VDAVPQQRADLRQHALAASRRDVPSRVHRHYLPHLARGHALARQRVPRIEPADVPHQEHAAGTPGGGDHPPTLGRGAGHGFFQQHVLTGPQRGERWLEVIVDVRHHAHGFDLRIR
jgi:hypothetical protein